MNTIKLYTDGIFLTNYYWIFIILGALILVALVIVLVASKKHMAKALKNIEEEKLNGIYDYFGGKDNMVSHAQNGSRLTVVLKDFSKLNKDKLKEAGVEKFVTMSDKCILVGKDVSKIEKALNNL